METKINQIEQTKQSLQDLILNIEQASKEGKRIDQVESHIFKSLIQIGKNLLLLYIELVKSKTENSLHRGKENGYQNKGLVNRSYFSIFGIVEYARIKYFVKKK